MFSNNLLGMFFFCPTSYLSDCEMVYLTLGYAINQEYPDSRELEKATDLSVKRMKIPRTVSSVFILC